MASPVLSGKAITPSGVTLEHAYGRCTGGLTYQSVKYGGAWPASGTIISKKGTYDDVIPTATCTPAVSATKCPTMIIQDVISCTLPAGPYNMGADVPAPTLVCAAEAGGAIRDGQRSYGGTDIPQSQNQWGNSGSGRYTTPGTKSNITVTGAYCGNTQYTDLNIPCDGSFIVNDVTRTCSVSGIYLVGQSISPPTLTCSAGTVDYNSDSYTATNVGGGSAGLGGQWDNSNDGWFTSAGTKNISATFRCNMGNNVFYPANANAINCSGSITINEPTATCTLPGAASAGSNITVARNTNVNAPTVRCSNITENVANHLLTFTINPAASTNNWPHNPAQFNAANATGHDVTVNVTCNGPNNTSVTKSNVSCGKIIVN
ncbi:MAG: hypothetical protein FWC15_07245 [Fibromonadales bacterium]|nr:hypothetical protein [Fibromonadales bacterium]